MPLSRINRRDFFKIASTGSLILGSALSAGQKLMATPEKDGTIFISDMSLCEPASRLTRTFDKDHWCLIDYETVEGVKGTMVSARPEETCGEIVLPLNVSGVYRIYIGKHHTKSHYKGGSNYGQIEAKLTRDKSFRRVGPEYGTRDEDGTVKFDEDDINTDKSIMEAFWKIADCTGQSLHIRQMPPPYDHPREHSIANLTYIRLVPVSKEELRQWKKLQPSEQTRRLAVIFCTGQFTGHTRGTYTFHPTVKSWFDDEFTPFADCDFKLLIFEALRGSSCVYRTKIGSMSTRENEWQKEWQDPLKEFTRLAHVNDMKIFASMRFIGPQYPMNRAPIAWAVNYWRHPELTMRTKEGIPITNLSLAYPEVREYWLSLLRETLDYGTDGVQIHFNRSEPYVFYEEPVSKAFEEKYGIDPRKIDKEDPRWLKHTASYVTQFVREIRALVDEKPGRELGVTLSGRQNGYEAHYEENQCDVDTWIKEGLVDYLMPTPHLHPDLLKKWRRLGGDSLHIWPDVMPRAQTAAGYAKTAKKYYNAGADGLCFWDGERRTARISEWAAAQRLGHADDLDYFITEGPSYFRAVPLKILGGFDVKYSFKDG